MENTTFSNVATTWLNKFGCEKKGKFAKNKKVSKRKTKVSMNDSRKYQNTWIHEEEDEEYCIAAMSSDDDDSSSCGYGLWW